ncbi:MAG TPA: hypothetical protein VFM97_04995, partial [Gammaproteobacteria bacterium]|nr:hypothetical protein [Gammaproteobacteria bacterium]
MKNKRSLYFLVLGLLICAPPLVSAYASSGGSVTPGDEIDKLYTVDKTLNPLGDDPVGGQVDLASGQLTIREVDVSIPGNSDLPVEFARTFTPDGHFITSPLTTDIGELHDWRIDIPKIYTVLAQKTPNAPDGGWPDDRCSAFGPPPPERFKDGYPKYEPSDYWHGYYVHIPGKGTQELLRVGNDALTPTSSSQYPIVTNNYWAIECSSINGGVDKNGEAGGTPGEGFILHTPDGWTYYFDRQTTEPVPALRKTNDGNILPRSRFVMLASRVEDPFGNWVAYHYDSSGKLTSITANDGRKIEVNYNSDGKVGSVVANGKTWTYAYSNGLLYTVTLPDGREWKFNLSALADAALYVDHPLDCTQGPGSAAPSSVSGTITGPYGTTVKFVLGAVRQGHADVPDDCLSDYVGAPGRAEYPIDYYTLALKSKTISGSNMASLTWTYQYSQTPGWYSGSSGATRKSVSVLDPDGGKTTYWFDIRLDWHEGNLDMIDYYLHASDSNYYRRVTNDYSLRDIQAGDSGVMWSNNERSRAIVRQSGQHIAQDGATYSWEVPNPDSDSSWDGYGDPLMRLEYNSSGQQLEKAYTYENLRSAWWLGQLASVTIKAPSDVANLVPYAATFLSSGRIGSVTKFGRLVGTYGWTGEGLLTKITDPAGYQTQLTNYYRGRPRNITFADGGQLTVGVNGDGTIASVTNTRGYTTNYAYDPLGRLKQITYPTNGTQSWDPTTFTLATCSYIPAGIDSGSLCRTETTGAETETTYYDSLLRPVLTRKGSSYVNRQFDSAGHVTYESYPSTNPTSSSGTQYFYDLLGRLYKVVRSTEDGDATESIAYGLNQKKVTDAKGNLTTYTYRNLSAPDDKLLMEIEAPESETTT